MCVFFLDFDLCSAFPLRCLPDVVGCQNGSWSFHFSHHNEVERLVNGNLREFFEVDPSFRVMLVFGKGLSCADGGSPRPPILHPANHLLFLGSSPHPARPLTPTVLLFL